LSGAVSAETMLTGCECSEPAKPGTARGSGQERDLQHSTSNRYSAAFKGQNTTGFEYTEHDDRARDRKG
jgi:hypothetical protein